jgi:hypothetical protein
MPSARKPPRYSRSQAAGAADACKTACGELAAGAPRTEEGDFIDQTIAIWQKRTERKLTREDGRQIIENISGFFSILQEWERKERAAQRARTALSSDSKVGRHARRNEVEAEIGPSPDPVKAENQA